MDFKRIFRGPLIWVIIAGVAIFVAVQLVTASNFREITTQQGLSLLDGATVEKAKIVDGEQRVDLTLSSDYKEFGKTVQFYYVSQRADDVITSITTSGAKFDDEVPQANWLS